jgi:sugar phosphate isomerase/epimerase
MWWVVVTLSQPFFLIAQLYDIMLKKILDEISHIHVKDNKFFNNLQIKKKKKKCIHILDTYKRLLI